MSGSLSSTAFYCMSSEVYFHGAVALVNSLRLQGHTEPIYLLDCGLRPEQRACLEPHVTLVDAPGNAPPFLLKTVAPLAHPAETMVLIDADMIVTRSLAPLVETAARGGVVAVANDTDRFVSEWGKLLDVGPVRRATYVSSGLVMLGGGEAREVLELLADRQGRIDFERSYFGREPDVDYPFLYLDQDVLNAIIAARVDSERMTVVENRLAPNPPYRGVRVVDAEALRCAYDDGVEPYVLHQYVRKPWLEPTLDTPYSRLLRRLLGGSGLTVRVPEEMVPRHVRGGVIGAVARGVGAARAWTRWHLPERLPDPIGARMTSWFEKRSA